MIRYSNVCETKDHLTAMWIGAEGGETPAGIARQRKTPQERGSCDEEAS